MQLVVVIAVKNAVSAATTTFTAISIILFFMQLVVVIAVKNAVSAATTTFTAISIILFFIR